MIIVGDCRKILPTLPERSVRCCVTSPPYFGLRDYGHPDQMGMERTPDEYVAGMVAVFREVRRVLTDDGTLWLNIGDSYANDGKWGGATGGKHVAALHGAASGIGRGKKQTGFKPKDLIGIPWMLAFALRADGWTLRSDIIWHKPNPMPESVTDRPTKSHEYVFLLSKSARYFYDYKAISDRAKHAGKVLDYTGAQKANEADEALQRTLPRGRKIEVAETRNARTVWTIPTRGYDGAHFAVMPTELAKRCILAGSAPGDTVLDPFFGSGTTGQAAESCGRKWIGIELNEKYETLGRERTAQMGML